VLVVGLGGVGRFTGAMAPEAETGWETCRFVTLCVSAFRTDEPSLVTSAMLGASGAEFCVSSMAKSMFVMRCWRWPLRASSRMPVAGCAQRMV
jgi:hypothetical protein